MTFPITKSLTFKNVKLEYSPVEDSINSLKICLSGAKGTFFFIIPKQYVNITEKLSFVWVNENIIVLNWSLLPYTYFQNTVFNQWFTYFEIKIKQALIGITLGYSIQIEAIGLGFRFILLANRLFLLLGYSHGIELIIPETLQLFCQNKTILTITGINILAVTQFANKLLTYRTVNRYKGTGLRYKNLKLNLKSIKQK